LRGILLIPPHKPGPNVPAVR